MRFDQQCQQQLVINVILYITKQMPINVKSPFKATFCIHSNQFFLINIKRNHLESGHNVFVKFYLFNWGKEGGFPPREHYGIPQINILGGNCVRNNTTNK